MIVKSRISILGICVLRDIFGLHINDGDYQIERFVQSVSPISTVSETMLQRDIKQEDKEVESIFQGLTNFYKRNLMLDLNKYVFSYFSVVHSDYFMIDAGACRYDLLKWSSEKAVCGGG